MKKQGETTIENEPWNKGKAVGQMTPFTPNHADLIAAPPLYGQYFPDKSFPQKNPILNPNKSQTKSHVIGTAQSSLFTPIAFVQ